MREFTNDDKAFMRLALEEAALAFQEKEVPIGAVIAHKNKILARAHNKVELFKDATCHAEILCIKEAAKILGDFRLSETTLYVTLEPCIMCLGASILSRVGTIIWGCSDKRHGALGGLIDLSDLKHPIHQPQILAGLLADESRDLIQKFFKERRDENKNKR
jgi:tRNA(adenine34) deaminase